MLCGCEILNEPVVARQADGDVVEIDFAIEGITCAACLGTIERTLMSIDGVIAARLNFTNQRAHVAYDSTRVTHAILMEGLRRAGYKAKPFVASEAEEAQATQTRYLLRCLAVAGFGAMNIMLLSVAIWAGAGDEGVSETRDFFHWLSALIAVPVCAYAGRPFLDSALAALRAGRTNMDVPISIGVILTLGMSFVETARHAEHAYFDGATMLLFFLLCGRYLDQAMRRKTRAVAGNLAALKARDARRIEPDGVIVTIAAAALRPGDRVLIRPGERVPVDGLVIEGASLMDESLVSGETTPREVGVEDMIYGGMLALDGALTIRCTAASGDTLVDEIDRLISRACEMKSRHMLLADRVARLYAPVVHLAAILTFAVWMLMGASAHDALVTAITVLIITCPCALGLAAPVVQVIAAGSLFRAGVLLNSADSIERLAEVDTVVFDKTGTLTLPEPRVVNAHDIPSDILETAARLALSSHHPLAGAVAREARLAEPLANVRETAGQGVEADMDGLPVRLGSALFCGLAANAANPAADQLSVIAFAVGEHRGRFLVRQNLRSDARAVIDRLKDHHFRIVILSGDRPSAVEEVARTLGIDDWRGGLKPSDKIAALEEMSARGSKVLMVGDGLNDAPALAAAHVSMSPTSASDLTQAHADAMFVGEQLGPVADAVDLAVRARRLMRENLALAIGYNAIAVPLAMLGHVTPLIAALAMSGSSIIVSANALRARGRSPTFQWLRRTPAHVETGLKPVEASP